MRRHALVLAALAALAVVGSGSAASTAAGPSVAPTAGGATLVITGHGWGHGMGMSQWGAYGYALHGWDAAKILDHYFPGTTLGRAGATVARVLLADGVQSAVLSSASRWKLVDAAGTRLALPAGDLDLAAPLTVKTRKLVFPVTFKPGAAPLELGGRPYRGSLVVDADGSSLQVVNRVDLEAYVNGVVGEEVSSAWPEAALEAQAIAARSYALSELALAGDKSTFDLYADGRSQVYGGLDAESPSITSAVEATAHRVVLYDGKVATTLFSSSSGGQTASAADAGGPTVPYLVSVSDPWDTYAPYHDWGLSLSPGEAGKKLGLDGPLLGLVLDAGADGRVTSATAQTKSGDVTLTGDQMRDDLGLRSSWFAFAWVGPGSPALLAGTALPSGSPATRAP